ncbi:MAG: NADH-quinone oxidoreductase subunit N [Thermoleophilaceae bacterium]|nr:NADH-quinone oxidoreductase subunit N [Thermoleophilaceae bacterium]
MSLLAAVAAPKIDVASLSPLIALIGGSVVVLMVSLASSALVQRVVLPILGAVTLLAAGGLSIWIWEPGRVKPVVEGALVFDTLTLFLTLLFAAAGLATIALSVRDEAIREAGAGEYLSLLLGSIVGMVLLAGATNLVTFFLGLELLSIPLYVLCASLVRRRESLESGLKYLVIGSFGSATLLYGLALVYGATGATGFNSIARAVGAGATATDPLLLTGVALAVTGLAFKASIAPFHQWTPDVYQGAPTPITTFMAVATKAAAFGIILRFFLDALPDAIDTWAPALAALAIATIVIGNLGAIGQRSLKRMLAWSGVAQAGYLLAGVVVGTRLGLQATVFYLAIYLLMNVAAFAVIVARERFSEHGDDLRSLEGLGRASPWLAASMTVAMLALAGIPGTAGLWGKFYLIRATFEGDYGVLGVAIVVGSIISLVYYLRVIATMWFGPVEIRVPDPPARQVLPVGGGSPEADAHAQPEVAGVAILCAAATVFFGLIPAPLMSVAVEVGTAL